MKELREAAGYTQADLCYEAKLTPDGLSKLERGLRTPGWETLCALADALGVSLDEFRKPPTKRPAEPVRGRPKRAKASLLAEESPEK